MRCGGPGLTSTIDARDGAEPMKETPEPAIEVRGLWKYFGHFPAIRGLDLTLARGRFLSVFGPNGAGKTTLIRVLSTQLKPSEGTVTVGGVDVAARADLLRHRIGLISHNTYLYGHLSGIENLLFYGRMYGLTDPRTRAMDLLGPSPVSGDPSAHTCGRRREGSRSRSSARRDRCCERSARSGDAAGRRERRHRRLPQ